MGSEKSFMRLGRIRLGEGSELDSTRLWEPGKGKGQARWLEDIAPRLSEGGKLGLDLLVSKGKAKVPKAIN